MMCLFPPALSQFVQEALFPSWYLQASVEGIHEALYLYRGDDLSEQIICTALVIPGILSFLQKPPLTKKSGCPDA